MSSISNSLTATQLQITVAKKQLESIEQQGRDALTLIHASAPPEVQAAAPPANTAPGVGNNLNIVG
jgi:hypothetical protein